ncbi:MAG: hypothetical protein M3Q64_02875, partial [bacterium]|nr:hypothetical protein [bacterium]
RALSQFQDDEDNNRFRSNLNRQLAVTAKDRTEFEGKVVSESEVSDIEFKNAAENKINAVAKVIATVEVYLSKKSQDASVSSKTSAQAQLQLAKTELEQARMENTNEDYRSSFISANEAIRLAHQAKAVLRIGHNLKVDVDVTDDSVIKTENRSGDNDRQNSGSKNSSEVRTDSSVKIETETKVESNNKVELKLDSNTEFRIGR